MNGPGWRVFSPSTQCDGKVAYVDKATAKRAARKTEYRLGRMRPYRCPHCGAWHIGHKPPPQRGAA